MDEKRKVTDQLQKHDKEKLQITKALQEKLDEKISKINEMEQQLAHLEKTSGKLQKNLERNFQSDL